MLHKSRRHVLLQKEQLLDKIKLIDGEQNRKEFKDNLIQIFQGMKDVATGFLKIAHAAEKIKEKRYYKEIGYTTFDIFCKDVLGLTRKTVYLYLRIDELLGKYPKLFDESFVTRIGSAKMDKLIVGLNRTAPLAGLRNITISIPPLEEQQEIVRQVDGLFAFAYKVETHYRKAKVKIDRLSQSVLDRAFRGELVPQDPDDEPAEKLLERIKEEKVRLEMEPQKNRSKNTARKK
jgi:hypothetical protein